MKSINILSLVQARASLKDESFKEYKLHYGIDVKGDEVDDLGVLVKSLRSVSENIRIFNGFYVGYTIPQIGKEFDLLRFGKKSVVNIELKRTSTTEKIVKQLQRNKYYLSYTGKRVYNLCYVSHTKTLYRLDNNGWLYGAKVEYLQKLLSIQNMDGQEAIDAMFNPSDYLVSPFNSTDRFLQKQYFLTQQQEDIRTKFLKEIDAAKSEKYFSVFGAAGTGKTLLVYDIVNELRRQKKKPLIIHCGVLNEGQSKLKKSGWNIDPIKSYRKGCLSGYEVVVVDEAQRIYPNQFKMITDEITQLKICCIFSYDKMQTLAQHEVTNDIDGKINGLKNLIAYKLSEKIRTNKEIANFIKMLFNKKRNIPMANYGNIEVNYFGDVNSARWYLGSLDGEKWKILRFTPSQYRNEHHKVYSDATNETSHAVVGQEFDNVVVIIDKYFSYNEAGDLHYKGRTYYHSVKMLFQNITRARKKVNVVIIANEELLNRCMSILR